MPALFYLMIFMNYMSQIYLNSKSIARIAAIQAIYQFKNNKDIESVLLRIIDFYKNRDVQSDYEIEKMPKLKIKPSFNYLKELVNYTYENINEIDVIIDNHLVKKWTLNSLSQLLLAILRVAICEMKYFPEIPSKVIINEYTDIASDMLDVGEIGFVNSVLDNYSTNYR